MDGIHKAKERAKRAFGFFAGAWSQYDYGAWVITDKHNGQLVGDCYLESGEISGETWPQDLLRWREEEE